MNSNYNVNGFNKDKLDEIMGNYKKSFKTVAIILGGLIALYIIFNAFTFTVDERYQVVVKQFDNVIKVIVDKGMTEELQNEFDSNSKLRNVKIVEGKGLMLKIPFIQTIEYYTNMLLTYDTDSREVTTRDKKKLILDNFAQWTIHNPALFSMSFGSIRNANTRIDDIIYSKLNEEIGKVNADVVISDKSNSIVMLSKITDDSNTELSEYGIRIVDIRIKRTDLPEENFNFIFNRMRTERQREASRYRSEGLEQAQKNRSEADKIATIIEAEAYEKAEEIKGEGDAEAVKIYAEAFNKDPEFYQFYRTLLAYRATLKENTTIVIDPDSVFAKYLFDLD